MSGMNTIADFLIYCINNGAVRSMHRPIFVRGMGEIWKFVPDAKYGPGYLINYITGSVMGVAELSDRLIDEQNNDWAIINISR